MATNRKSNKWGLCADWQFALGNRLSTPNEQNVSSRLNDALNCFDWVVNTCVQQGCEGLFILGDVFDSRTVLDLPVIDRVCRKMKEVSQRLPLSILSGNHDSYLRQSSINSLQMFLGVATVHSVPCVVGDFAFVPWTEDVKDFENAVIGCANAGAKYLLSHMLVEGAVPKASGVPVGILHPERFERIFLGDVHSPECVDTGGPTDIQYVGSAMQIDYRDVDGLRGFIIFDAAANDFEYFQNEISPRFHILSDISFEEVRKGDYVRVRTGSAESSRVVVEALKQHSEEPIAIESDFVEVEDLALRLDVHSSDGEQAVIKKYVDYVIGERTGERNKRLVSLGTEIFEEAR